MNLLSDILLACNDISIIIFSFKLRQESLKDLNRNTKPTRKGTQS